MKYIIREFTCKYKKLIFVWNVNNNIQNLLIKNLKFFIMYKSVYRAIIFKILINERFGSDLILR